MYGGLFFYGPPWAPVFALFAALPYGLLHVAIIALDFVALWVIAGRSWVRAGLLLWIPLVISEMASGQLNILCAGAIVEAQRGRVWPLAVLSWAKLWPALALPPRKWKPFLIAVVAFGLIALPWPYLFPDWIDALLGNIREPAAPLVPVPFLLRLPVALVLVAIQRPWTRALGAMLASPNLYWGQLVVVIAPIALWIQERSERRREPPATEPAAPVVSHGSDLSVDCRDGRHDAARRRERMVQDQLVRRGIRDERVLAAMGAVPRERFVDPARRAPRVPRRGRARSRTGSRSASRTWSRA